MASSTTSPIEALFAPSVYHAADNILPPTGYIHSLNDRKGVLQLGSTFLKEPEMRKLRELQILDRMSEEQDNLEWDVMEAIKHQTA